MPKARRTQAARLLQAAGLLRNRARRYRLAGALFLAAGMTVAATGLTGCGGIPVASAPPANASPLSLEEWRKISEPHVRNDPETLERLKKGNRDLQTQEGWEAFEREELAKAEP